jgi:hypothetical protein
LVVTCTDLFLPKNILGSPIVLVQEGITDPESAVYRLVKRLPFLPRWLAGTATPAQRRLPGLLLASEGYRDFFIRKGVRPGRSP